MVAKPSSLIARAATDKEEPNARTARRARRH
jgi:hypothetical protein